MKYLYVRREWFAMIVVGCLLVSLFPGGGRAQSGTDSGILLGVDTAVPNQDGLLTLYGGQLHGGQIGLPVACGDLNHDGKADVVFCEMFASVSPQGTRVNNGQVNVYISDGSDSGTVDAVTQPAKFKTILGERSGDLLGTSVEIGDVNGDGFGDIVIAATGQDGPASARPEAGAVYVIPGSANFNSNPNIDLATTDGQPPPGVTVIYGPEAGCRFGIWVDAGDVDGDGIADIIVGADQLNSSAGNHVGGAFIIFGSHTLPSVIDLAAPPQGVRITQILGVSQQDHWGACVHAGDIDNDGIKDVVISAALDRDSASYISPLDPEGGDNFSAAGDGGLRPACGEVYVLYGSKNWPAFIDLRNPPADATHIIGATTGDFLGSQLFSADLNGDGKRDLILGALQARAPDPVGRPGGVFVIYGGTTPTIHGATIDLLTPNAGGFHITAIYGENNLDCAGDSVRAYDINNDGMAELFIGSPDNTFTIGNEEREDAGDTKVIFGQAGFLPPVVKLYDLPPDLKVFRLAGAHGQDQGINGGDSFSYRLAGGDVDGDGFVDYVANAMEGDGLNNGVVDAGNVYIFSGKKLSSKLGFLTPMTAPAPILTSAALLLNGQATQQASAGQSGLSIVITGTGFTADTQISVNSTVVVSHIPVDPTLVTTQRTVLLDENPGIRNTPGLLSIQAQKTNPPSPVSNVISAGTLIGPVISSASIKVKPSGVTVLNVFGSNFQATTTIAVTNAAGQPVPTKPLNVIDSQTLKVKITATLASGAVVSVRVTNSGGVLSNTFMVTVP